MFFGKTGIMILILMLFVHKTAAEYGKYSLFITETGNTVYFAVWYKNMIQKQYIGFCKEN